MHHLGQCLNIRIDKINSVKLASMRKCRLLQLTGQFVGTMICELQKKKVRLKVVIRINRNSELLFMPEMPEKLMILSPPEFVLKDRSKHVQLFFTPEIILIHSTYSITSCDLGSYSLDLTEGRWPDTYSHRHSHPQLPDVSP